MRKAGKVNGMMRIVGKSKRKDQTNSFKKQEGGIFLTEVWKITTEAQGSIQERNITVQLPQRKKSEAYRPDSLKWGEGECATGRTQCLKLGVDARQATSHALLSLQKGTKKGLHESHGRGNCNSFTDQEKEGRNMRPLVSGGSSPRET